LDFQKPDVDQRKLAKVMEKAKFRDFVATAKLAVKLPAKAKHIKGLDTEQQLQEFHAHLGRYLQLYGPKCYMCHERVWC
jgi:cytochrome c1